MLIIVFIIFGMVQGSTYWKVEQTGQKREVGTFGLYQTLYTTKVDDGCRFSTRELLCPHAIRQLPVEAAPLRAMLHMHACKVSLEC